MPVNLQNVASVQRLETRAAAISLGVGAALTAAKFLAYFLTGSTAVFSDALESIVNVAAAAFAAYSLTIAHQPADSDHPYGHGKIEFMSAGFEGGMVLFAAIVAAAKGVDGLVYGNPKLQSSSWLVIGLMLMTSTLVVNAAMGIYLVRVGRHNGSLTLEADGHHLLSDVWSTGVALVAIGAVKLTGWRWVDPVAALCVAAFISRTGISLLKRSAAGLMDRQDEDDERLLQHLLKAHIGPVAREPRACSFHKLRHRHSGRYHWVDFHLVLPAAWDIAHGHRVASAIEHEIENALGEGKATAHVEPCAEGDCDHCRTLPGEPAVARQGSIDASQAVPAHGISATEAPAPVL